MFQDAERFDFDFIKMMPFGLYSVHDYGPRIRFSCRRGEPPEVEDYGIHRAEDWGKLRVFDAEFGTLGKTLEGARFLGKLAAGKFPFVQTLFSPLTSARKLAGDRVFSDLREHPALLKQGLEAFTAAALSFVEAHIEAGVSGFFFATQCAARDLMSPEEYAEFGRPYDLEIIRSFAGRTPFNILHLHGEHCMFDELLDYPVNCVNWHDRSTPPSLAEARGKTDKCLLGGIQESPRKDGAGRSIPSFFNSASPPEVEAHVHEAIRAAGGRGIIIGPGCVTDPFAPEENIRAVRRALDTYRG
jgi:uroporphyrinogen decarboxylase